MLSRMAPSSPHQKRTLHLLNNADILCANDSRLFGSNGRVPRPESSLFSTLSRLFSGRYVIVFLIPSMGITGVGIQFNTRVDSRFNALHSPQQRISWLPSWCLRLVPQKTNVEMWRGRGHGILDGAAHSTRKARTGSLEAGRRAG